MDWNTLNTKQKLVSVALVLGLAVFLFLGFGDSLKSDDVRLEVGATADEESSQHSNSYYVEITGQVNFPGVYELNRPMLVLELIELAGGATKLADLEFIHKDLSLSKPVAAEQKIFVPSIGTSKSSALNNSLGKISLNSATAEELATLPGVGPATAEKIILGRPYSELADLKEVSGIGEATYNKIVTSLEL